jgi:fluoride exporter
MQPSLYLFTLVGLGGMLGSMARYWVTINVAQSSPGFPVGTLIVNIVGCFVIAVVAMLAEKTTLISPETRLFLTTGLCGGFTTFSALMYEVSMLLRDNEWWYAGIYVSASLMGGFLALYLGILMVNKWV